MCGIFGYLAYGTSRPTYGEIANMAKQAESRGSDASGLAWERADGGGMGILKAPKKASDLLTEKVMREVLAAEAPRLLIGHTRARTQGHQRDNLNNHPQFSKVSGTALVHNGQVDTDCFEQDKSLVREAEVDTEALLRVWDSTTGTDAERVGKLGEKVPGSYAVALISSNQPGKLVLIRNSSPLRVSWDDSRELFMFGSTDEIVYKLSAYAWGKLPWYPNPIAVPDDSFLVADVAQPRITTGSFKPRARSYAHLSDLTRSWESMGYKSSGLGSAPARSSECLSTDRADQHLTHLDLWSRTRAHEESCRCSDCDLWRGVV